MRSVDRYKWYAGCCLSLGPDNTIVCTTNNPTACLPFKESSRNVVSNGLCLSRLPWTKEAPFSLAPCITGNVAQEVIKGTFIYGNCSVLLDHKDSEWTSRDSIKPPKCWVVALCFSH